MTDDVTINVKLRCWVNLMLIQVWTCWVERAALIVVVLFYPWIVTFEFDFKRGRLITVKVSGKLL